MERLISIFTSEKDKDMMTKLEKEGRRMEIVLAACIEEAPWYLKSLEHKKGAICAFEGCSTNEHYPNKT